MRLVCISTIEWDALWQRHHQFMAEFVKHNWEVCYVENMGFRGIKRSDFNRILRLVRNYIRRGKAPSTRANRVPRNLQIVTPLVLPPGSQLFRWLNKVWFIPRLRRKIKRLGFVEADIAYVYLPAWSTIDLLTTLQPKCTVFDCVANFRGHPSRPLDYEDIERNLLSMTDVVVTDSDFLYEQMHNRHGSVYKLHHGVDVTVFEQAFSPAPPLNYHSVCFFGTVDDRIDWDVIKAFQENGVHVRIVGVAIATVPEGVSLLGALSFEALGEFLASCDALIIPYRVNEFTKGIIPAKLFECLATGKPTLASPLPYTEYYKDVLYVCETPAEYISVFKALPKTESTEIRGQRHRIALSNSSERAFLRLLELIQEAAGEK